MSPGPAPKLRPDYISALRETVRTADYPSLMSMELTDIDMDQCEIRIDIAQKHFQPFGIVHGGVIATIVDTATFWAGFARIDENDGLVNVDLKLNYLRPVTKGPLVARGRCIKAGRQLSYTEANVFVGDELVAHGTSTLMVLTGFPLAVGVPKFCTTSASSG